MLTFDKIGFLYINGHLRRRLENIIDPENLIRTENFIGWSNRNGIDYSTAAYSDLKVYEGALNSKQVMAENLWSSPIKRKYLGIGHFCVPLFIHFV